LSESQDDFEDLETIFSLTVDTLNSWRRAQNSRRINGIEKDVDPSAKYDIPSPVESSTPPISSPAYVVPARLVPCFRSNIERKNHNDVPSIASYVQQLPIMTPVTSWTSILFPVHSKRMLLNRSKISCTISLQTSF
jgi:hypothetical protein